MKLPGLPAADAEPMEHARMARITLPRRTRRERFWIIVVAAVMASVTWWGLYSGKPRLWLLGNVVVPVKIIRAEDGPAAKPIPIRPEAQRRASGAN